MVARHHNVPCIKPPQSLLSSASSHPNRCSPVLSPFRERSWSFDGIMRQDLEGPADDTNRFLSAGLRRKSLAALLSMERVLESTRGS